MTGIAGLDHRVLAVADVEAPRAFYARVLEVRVETFGGGRKALRFGARKINLHAAGHEIEPHAARPLPGPADLCLLLDGAVEQMVAHLAACGVPVELGPVRRTGARGPVTSVYLRDPDGNLLELPAYQPGEEDG